MKIRLGWWKKGALFLLLYLLFVIAQLPAEQLVARAAPQMQQLRLALGGVEGTVWNGRAQRVVLGGKELGAVRWDLSLFSLLTAGLGGEVELQTDEGYLRGDLRLGAGGGVSLSDVDGQVPVAWLVQFATFMPVTLEGLVSLKLEEAELEGGRPVAAAGEVVWHQAAMSSPQQLPFGDLELQLGEGEGDVAISGQLRDRGGPLSLDATLLLQQDGNYTLEGSVAPGKGAPANMAGSLGMLGRPDRDGRVPLNLKGAL